MDAARIMNRAIALAERGGGGTAPNPMVGCVIVDADGAVVGEGYHARAGGPHAEVVAMEAARAAGTSLAGATFVVSLEPCAAFGRTPPCTEAIVAAGARRVVYAVEDPAHGKGGAQRLRASGIEVEHGVREAGARRLVEAWLHFVATGRPFFHVKVARTASGHVTRGAGGERWITGPAARAYVHRLRRRHAAVLVGIGTVLADDPELTVRDWPVRGEGADTAHANRALEDSLPDGGPLEDGAPGIPWPGVQPRRVVLDAALQTPLGSRLVTTAGASPVTIFCRADADSARRSALESRGIEVAPVPASARGLDLAAVAEALAARDVTGVLSEPGPALLAGLLEAGLVDRWTAITSPDDAVGPGALRGPDPAEIALHDVEEHRLGPDFLTTGLVRRP